MKLEQTKRDLYISYVPHGVNPNVFYPIDFNEPKDVLISETETKKDVELYEEVKENLLKSETPDFIVLFVGRNMRRKNPADLILGYKHFCDMLPKNKSSKCILLFHTSPADINGTDLVAVASNVCPEYRVIFSPGFLPQYALNILYNLADITVLPSSNEGFGVPLIESLSAGTMIMASVTGGMQDIIGFCDENGNLLDVEVHYDEKWSSNHDKRYKIHGDWAIPIFPTNRSLQGSVETPYIFDDRIKFEHIAIGLKMAYDLGREERKRRGLLGRKFILNDRVGMNSSAMCKRIMEDIDHVLNNFKPKNAFELYEVQENESFSDIGYTISEDDLKAFEKAKKGIYEFA